MAHAGFVSNLVGRHPAFLATARLFRRWLGSQLLGYHVSPELQEILLAATFSSLFTAATAAATPAIAFLRSLQLLGSFPLADVGLIVEGAGQTDREGVAALEAARKEYLNLAAAAPHARSDVAYAFAAVAGSPHSTVWAN